MEIVIHGTKGGWQIFTEKKTTGILDVTPDSVNGSPIGQEAWGLRILEDRTLYTKYKIVRDVRGAKRIGFIAFTLSIANNKKISSQNTILLLNEISQEYIKEYIPENDNNLKGTKENWNFLDQIIDKYKKDTISINFFENIKSGTKEDAFIYYKNELDLQNYFEQPYQEEFIPYRQILFIDEVFKGKQENPLNGLRHSDNNLTGKIDLENPKYTFLLNPILKSGINIEVYLNKKRIIHKSKISRKDNLEIIWTKNYHKSYSKEGKWTEIGSDYISIDDDSKTISIKEIDLPIKSKSIQLKTIDYRNNIITETEIIYMCGSEKRSASKTELIFSGKEIEQTWKVLAKKDENLYSDEIAFIPSNSIELTLILNRRKRIEIIVHSESLEGKKLEDFRISKNEFINDEIFQEHILTVSSQGHEQYSFKYNPERDGGKKKIYLKLKSLNISKLDNFKGENDGLKNTYPKRKENTNKYIFKNPIKLGILILLTIVTIFSSLWLYFYNGNNEQDNNLQFNIKKYVEGTELNLDHLNSFKSKWETQKPESKENDWDIWKILTLSTDTGNKEISELNTWYKVDSSLIRAIEKRELINSLKFQELKKLRYSNQQQEFKNFISKIDSTQELHIRSIFSADIKILNLNEIQGKIDSTLNTQNDSIKENIKEVEKEVGKEQNNSNKAKKPSKPTISESAQINKLKSDEISEQSLNNLKLTATVEERNSIELYETFWNLVNKKRYAEYSDFNNLKTNISEDRILKESKLKTFLDNYCKSATEFDRKYNNKMSRIQITNNTNLKELDDKLNSIK
ncbi:MAG: hypothetical protein ACK4SF_13840 [Algoriphagus aquaeductus]|uniref:hypothetical protein n=1 Tax=Algoriphagus aquaeductus TaxID=475299 RepID=UPI00391B93B6